MGERARHEARAIIDIGSNSVRLVVYGGPARAPSVLLNEKVTAKLGKNLADEGRLSEKGMKTALAALGRYAALLRLMGVTEVETVATAAARDATNGAAFLASVSDLGLSPRLLSGEEEAMASAQGVLAAFPGARGIVADLGGGSLELTELDGASCHHGVTMPFGTLRLGALRQAGPRKFTLLVREALHSAGWTAGAGMPMYLVGGSLRALARYAMAELAWPLDDPHGWKLDAETALKLCRTVTSTKLHLEVPRLSASRLASLPDAAALLAVLIREIGPDCLIFSSWGLREGLLFAKAGAAVLGQDPLLAGVAAFAEGHDVSPAAATMVQGWTAEVCDAGESNDERLRLAATMLALAVQRVEPNRRTEQAMDWALRKRWIGIDDRGRALLAMAAIANTGRTSTPDEFLRLASRADLVKAVTWGLAIRLCRKFSGCVAPSLAGSALTLSAGRLVLSMQAPLSSLYTDAVEKELRLLANWLEAEPAVEGIGVGSPARSA